MFKTGPFSRYHTLFGVGTFRLKELLSERLAWKTLTTDGSCPRDLDLMLAGG